ncbi:MAG: hypothetical protein Q4E16_00490 [Neisseria sp.]|nr:hypothetical protein [Neisseria sp.]
MKAVKTVIWGVFLALALALIPSLGSEVHSADMPSEELSCAGLANLAHDEMSQRQLLYAKQCDIAQADAAWRATYGTTALDEANEVLAVR